MKRHKSSDRQPSSSAAPSRGRRIALIYDATAAYDVKVMMGVAEYIHKTTKWNVYIEESALRDQHLPSLRTWKGHGIIANFDHPGVARQVMRSGLPAVAFGSGYGWYSTSSDIPYFYTNNANISQAAAQHLIDKGLQHFAFCGYPANPINGWCLERQQAFYAELSKRGFACHVFPAKQAAEQTWATVLSALSTWLLNLPKPIGIFAANDIRGRHLLECCRESDLRVPDQISVLGVDNDELLCGLSSPLLSSIEQGAVRLGYEAAKLLDTMMGGLHRTEGNRFVIDAVGVVARTSTDILAIDDEAVAKALRYIASHGAQEIAAQLPPEYMAGDRALYVSTLQQSKAMFTADGVMPAGGPANVLRVMRLAERGVTGKPIDLSRTYTTEFAQAAR